MARILDSVKSMAGKMMASPYDKPGMDSVKMSSTGEVRAYVPPVQQRVKKPARQATEQQQPMVTGRQQAVPPQPQQEPRQGFFGSLFKRNAQPAQEPQPYTGSQPPMGNMQYTAQHQLSGMQPQVSDQQPFNTVLSGQKAEQGSVKGFFSRVFGTSKMNAQPEQPAAGQTGWQQPMPGFTGNQQPPMTGRQMPPYTAQQPQQMGYTAQQPQQMNYTAQQPQQMNYTAQQPQQMGYTAQQPQQTGYTAQQPQQTGYTAQQPQQGGQYFSGQQPVQQGAPRPAKGYFRGNQGNQQSATGMNPSQGSWQSSQKAQQVPPQGNWQSSQKAQQVPPQGNWQSSQKAQQVPPQGNWQSSQQVPPQRPQPAPDNVSYMNAGNFVDEDGRSYAMIMRVAQPVGTATCYRIIEFIRNGESVLVNTELITDQVELTRSLDLLFGAAFAMHACYTRVAQRSLYLITPGSVKVTLYPSLNDLHQRDNARHWPGSEQDNQHYYDQPQQTAQEQGYGRERHRRASRGY